MIFRNDVLRKLNQAGIVSACGKPLTEATLSELHDEAGRLELLCKKKTSQNIARGK